MKVAFLIQNRQAPSSRVRVLNLLPDLHSAGVVTEVIEYPRRLADKLRMLRRLRQFDIVVLQKKTPTPLETAILAWASPRLVYDFDDAVDVPQAADTHSMSRQRKFAAVLRHADCVIAGNRILAAKAEGRCARVEIIPSAIELRNKPVHSGSTQQTGPVRIGWIGGVNNLPYLMNLSTPLQALAQRHAIELIVISGEAIDVPGVTVVNIPWSEATQEEELSRLDIGLMPLPDDQHTAGKCGYKALQYMGVGVVPVVSDVGINADIVDSGKCGIAVTHLADFESALEKLICNPELRAQLGQQAYEQVRENFSVERISEQLLSVFRSLLQR